MPCDRELVRFAGEVVEGSQGELSTKTCERYMKAMGSLLLAETADEAFQAIVSNREYELIAGGTTTFPQVGPVGERRVGLISLHMCSELSGVSIVDDEVSIGAMTRVADLLTDPIITSGAQILAQAARTMGSRQVRARATVGGNIAVDRPDQTLVPTLLALDTRVQLLTSDGTSLVALSEYLQARGHSGGPARRDALVTAVFFKPTSDFSLFTRVGPTNGPGYPVVSIALIVDRGSKDVRLALGNVGETVFRAASAETFARQEIDWHNGIATAETCAEFGALAAADSNPATDIAATEAYRRHAISVMARRALEQAFEVETR